MKSMTGFGRCEKTLGSHHYSIEIKSVNHRFLDLRFRLPPAWTGCEPELSEHIRQHCDRGSLDISIRHTWTLETGQISGNTRFALDEKALSSFEDALKTLETRTQKKISYQLSDLMRTGKILVPIEAQEDRAGVFQTALPVFKEALKQLSLMRQREGEAIKKVLLGVIHEMRTDLDQITQLAPAQTQKMKERLETRLAQWKLGEPVEPRRLEWEVALLAEKSDITEEIDRLQSHFQAFTEAFELSVPIGRKLDFLTQELNREVNTIASKTSLMEITQLTVRLKSNIEKLREQVQNVE